MNARDRISKARVNLMSSKKPILSVPVMKLRLKEYNSIPNTAIGPDGTLFYSRAYAGNIQMEDLEFAFLHETWHWIGFYFERLMDPGVDQERKNRAHDIVIHNLFAEDGITIPSYALHRPEFKGLSLEEVYKRLEDEDKKGGGDGHKGCGGISHKCGDGSVPDSKDMEIYSQEIRAVLGEALARQKVRGDSPGAMERYVEGLLTPRVHWTDRVRAISGSRSQRRTRTRSRPSRRHPMLAGRRPKIEPDLALIFDTSGSVGVAEMQQALAEVIGILEEFGTLAYAVFNDADVQAHAESIEGAEELLRMVKGGGGSDFRPAFDWLEREGFRGAVIAFTDGMISVPENQPDYVEDMLWALFNDSDTPAKWGKEVKVEV